MEGDFIRLKPKIIEKNRFYPLPISELLMETIGVPELP